MTDLPGNVTKLAGYVPVTSELLADARGPSLTDWVFRPWLFADPSPMPEIVLFPRLQALADTVTRRLRRHDDWNDDDDG